MVSTQPVSTYRLQIRPSFTLNDAAEIVPYLHDLGVDWVYLSPLLRASAGSDHGYDAVDPTQIDPARGGIEGLRTLSAAAHAAGMGVLLDIVPNHLGVDDAAQNPWWWDVLAQGRASSFADAFDIDWDAGDGQVLLPVLGDDLEAVIARGEITLDTTAGTAAYYERVYPLAPGSFAAGDADVAQVLERQHWRLMSWRRGDAELNYRRFFTITGLAGVRVEDPRIFDLAHDLLVRLYAEGIVDGFRIDHPDGLVDPGGYLEHLRAALTAVRTSERPPYVLVEKILEHAATEHAEQLPGWWATDGTTGYDALAEIGRALIDPAGERGLDRIDSALRADSGLPALSSYADLIHGTKRAIADSSQLAEVARLVRLLPDDLGIDAVQAQDALAELLACFPVYRSYLPAGVDALEHARVEATRWRPDLAEAIDLLVPVLADPTLEVARRFQQTTGPVMAKGVEDTGFYRYTRLGALTEVGGDPDVFALDVEGFHRAQERRQAAWPSAMTALSTHDTKRSEDVRARLSVLAEMPDRWADTLAALRAIASTGHGPFDNLLWQAVVGAWPATPERIEAYGVKAAREAAEVTGWTSPNEDFESRIRAVAQASVGPDAGPLLSRFIDEITAFGFSNALSAKLLQLAGPGVPDVYQGTELWDLSLVDPDNRRAVAFDERRRVLAELDADAPADVPSGAAKLLLVSRVLRTRRDRPELFTRYRPVTVVGDAAEHAVVFDRGGVVAVATRLPAGLAARGGWGQAIALLSPGMWTDELTGRTFEGGEVAVAELLRTYPVALLTTTKGTHA